jgi:hypothetical protein
VGVDEILLDRGGTKPAGEYTFFYGKGNENHELGTPEDGDRSSLRNVVFFLSSIYQTMDKVQNEPYSSVQHTPSSESFQVYKT